MTKQKHAATRAVRVLMVLALAGCGLFKAQEASPAGDEHALQDFNVRIQNYVKIHHQAEQKFGLTTHIKATRSGEEIVKRQHAMAEHISGLRKKAGEGAIFTPEIMAYFARGLDSAYQSNAEGTAALPACIRGNAEQKLKPNDVYPETWDYSMMPPAMLLHIPRLPPELEYRLVNRDLIIRDLEANMVVDVMRNAIASGESVPCED
jgi:hypothetical protein